MSGEPAPLSIRPVTADDAEAVAELPNDVVRKRPFGLLDAPFSVEAEGAFVFDPAPGSTAVGADRRHAKAGGRRVDAFFVEKEV